LPFDTLADGGADGFYHGPVADDIVRAVQSAGGIMTRDDLARYKPVWREPLRVPYRGRYTWLLMPPPSSGGVVIGQVLRFLEPTDMTTLRRDDPAAAAHWLVEAMKHAYANRARWLGDPAFVHNPVAMMLDPTYAAVLAERSQWDHTLPPEAYGTTVLPPDAGTAHICVVDAAGNVVSWTETINTSFGALNETPKYGVVLNNEMDDFTAEPGKPNAFGLIQSARNAPAPGKRPLSSMSPTIILRDGKPWLVLGAAGGPRIISSVLNVGLHCIDGAQSLPDAMTAVRLHHQWMPDEIVPSAPLAKPIADALRRRGHTIAREPGSGHVQAIAIENGELIGVSDPNKGGGPVGAK
jgi:gamma-glutamyltranspeptidase/glutathione hydrolase